MASIALLAGLRGSGRQDIGARRFDIDDLFGVAGRLGDVSGTVSGPPEDPVDAGHELGRSVVADSRAQVGHIEDLRLAQWHVHGPCAFHDYRRRGHQDGRLGVDDADLLGGLCAVASAVLIFGPVIGGGPDNFVGLTQGPEARRTVGQLRVEVTVVVDDQRLSQRADVFAGGDAARLQRLDRHRVCAADGRRGAIQNVNALRIVDEDAMRGAQRVVLVEHAEDDLFNRLESDLLGDFLGKLLHRLLGCLLCKLARASLDSLLGCLLHRLLDNLFGCLSLGLVGGRVIR